MEMHWEKEEPKTGKQRKPETERRVWLRLC
jgi:hypothetical protein